MTEDAQPCSVSMSQGRVKRTHASHQEKSQADLRVKLCLTSQRQCEILSQTLSEKVRHEMWSKDIAVLDHWHPELTPPLWVGLGMEGETLIPLDVPRRSCKSCHLGRMQWH